MSDKREEIWANAFNARLTGTFTADEARVSADAALQLYEERWPIKYEAPVIGGVDFQMVKSAIASLEAEGRIDAARVLSSLITKLAEAQEQGKKLKEWGPPMRGA